MSVQILLPNQATEKLAVESRHRLRLGAAILASVTLVFSLALYGYDYYRLSAVDRPFSVKHQLLKPSGRIGVKLGFLGVALFAVIFLYPLRKRVRWLARRGNTKNWMDFHIVAGLTAPVIIAFHSSFKFGGIAGMAFWMMIFVALSGISGRYLYAQIPRSLTAAELSLRELQEMQDKLTRELSHQQFFSLPQLERVFRAPMPAEAAAMPIYRALFLMIALDLARPLHIALLRRRVLGWGATLWTLGGLLSTHNEELETIIRGARRKSSLSKRIAFLARSQQVFHLWHVIHRPVSYSFAVLAALHIVAMIGLGFI